ncbi:MAG: adenine phosphoribosyltransferase [Rhodospirillales bacterium]|nr:adenine phosphoribosyltransferase [Acetobacter sp.]
MNQQRLRAYIREAPGCGRCDLSRLLADADAFSAVVASMAAPYLTQRIDLIAALDASGFALGEAVAARLRTGLVLLRKPDKAAWFTRSQDFTDYRQRQSALHLVTDAVSSGQRVLVIDDWSETGAQALAAIQLLEQAGAAVVGASFIHLDARVRRDSRFRAYQLQAILDYDAPPADPD